MGLYDVGSPMAEEATTTRLRCIECGFKAVVDSDEWESVDHPTLGSMTACPECGSTNLQRPR
jgi:DNA-directed RNA polymerase subunit RPC12/RpoP